MAFFAKKHFVVAFAAATLLAVPARAHDYNVGALKVEHPWSRVTPKGATVGVGYMTITNSGTTPDRLVGGTSAASTRFELHDMAMDNGVMKMRPMTGGVTVKPGETVEFKPNGYHVMFVGLKEGFAEGQRIKATLEFEKAGKVDVEFSVDKMGAHSGH